MSGIAIVFLILVSYQFTAAVAFVAVYGRGPAWRSSAVGRHLMYWVAAAGALDLSWLLLLVLQAPWLMFVLFAVQFALGTLGWQRVFMVWRARHAPARLGSVEHYTSTACQHDRCGECRLECKFCAAPCRHDCHPVPPPSGADDARPTPSR